ncbi:DUF2057 family protein [Vibrio litoralis]|uniref:DUF2057 family protein n=1 Tax=Vibrio litoralis TaxID=335972 RepID=UPI0004190641|nr:DUF2057 family protein [Vibrio litoralis]
MALKRVLLKPITLCVLLGLSSSALANVVINIPSEVDVLAANGQEAEIEGGFFSSTKSITLPDGENQIVFRYSPVFKQGNDQTTVTTDAIITKFTASDTELNFDLPKYRNADLARDFDRNPDWKLVDEDGNAIEVKQDKLLKPGVQLGRNYDQESVAYNKTGAVAAIAPATAAVATTAAAPPQMPANSQYKTTEEQMLHYWYEKADSETKQRFLQAIIQAK